LQQLAGGVPVARQAVLRRIAADPDDVIDQALVLFFPAPASFTGEDCAEFHVHGSRAVVARVLAELVHIDGVRLAEPGEFTRRAFENGKIDLLEAEDLADLIDSDTELQRRVAVAGQAGRFRIHVDAWRAELMGLQALIEAQIDFSDEADIPAALEAELRQRMEALVAQMRQALADSLRSERLREGFVVALAGPPNAGKSSLLNALAKRDVAIVSPIAGTTRDILEVRLDLDGVPVLLRDLAGLRPTADPVESIGVARAEDAMREADVVVWLNAPDVAQAEAPAEIATKVIVLSSKADLGSLPKSGRAVSALTGAGLEEFIDELAARAKASFRFGESTIALNLRQEAALRAGLAALQRGLAAEGIEFLAEDVREAGAALRGLIGGIGVEEVLGHIFGRFCIGK
jgi:tRNA modification GTPase